MNKAKDSGVVALESFALWGNFFNYIIFSSIIMTFVDDNLL